VKDRKIIKERIPASYRLVCNVSKEGSSEEGDTLETIDLYQCDETGTYYLYYERRVFSFQFVAGSILLSRFYLEISKEERNGSKEKLIRLVRVYY